METLKHMRTRQGAPAAGMWGYRCGAAGQPQPAGEHGAPRGALRCVVHEAVGSAVKKVTVLVEICALIYFLFVCLFKTSSHFPEEALSDIPEEPWGCFFSSFSCSSHFFIPIFCLSFLLSCFLFLSFLPLFLSLSCARAF